MTVAGLGKSRLAFSFEQLAATERRIPLALLGWSSLGIALGFFALLRTEGDFIAMPYFLLLAVSFAGASALYRQHYARWHRDLVTVVVVSAASTVVLLVLPEYLYGHELNGIIHRSFFGSVLLMGVGSVAASASLNRVLGATPTSEDQSRYVLLFVPIAIAILAYSVVVVQLIDRGIDGLSLDVLTTAYTERLSDTTFQYEAGLRNHIVGTFLLVAMTTAIAIVPGVSAGVFMNEYPGKLAHVVRFSTTMLRAVSPFILAVAAFSLVQSQGSRAADDPISTLIRGSYTDANGIAHVAKGSFILAAMFLSLLVMPVIARATEEGLRSVPNDIREGSIAVGATDGHALRRILLPWSTPNIVTAVLLGAAEAAGSVAVLLLIAGTGQNGVGPLKEATSLSFAIFGAKYGPRPFQESMAQYQFTAALLLIVLTLTLTIAALYLKSRLGARYRAALTAE